MRLKWSKFKKKTEVSISKVKYFVGQNWYYIIITSKMLKIEFNFE